MAGPLSRKDAMDRSTVGPHILEPNLEPDVSFSMTLADSGNLQDALRDIQRSLITLGMPHYRIITIHLAPNPCDCKRMSRQPRQWS